MKADRNCSVGLAQARDPVRLGLGKVCLKRTSLRHRSEAELIDMRIPVTDGMSQSPGHEQVLASRIFPLNYHAIVAKVFDLKHHQIEQALAAMGLRSRSLRHAAGTCTEGKGCTVVCRGGDCAECKKGGDHASRRKVVGNCKCRIGRCSIAGHAGSCSFRPATESPITGASRATTGEQGNCAILIARKRCYVVRKTPKKVHRASDAKADISSPSMMSTSACRGLRPTSRSSSTICRLCLLQRFRGRCLPRRCSEFTSGTMSLYSRTYSSGHMGGRQSSTPHSGNPWASRTRSGSSTGRPCAKSLPTLSATNWTEKQHSRFWLHGPETTSQRRKAGASGKWRKQSSLACMKETSRAIRSGRRNLRPGRKSGTTERSIDAWLCEFQKLGRLQRLSASWA